MAIDAHPKVIHPRDIIKRDEAGLAKFNTALALKITTRVGSMWTAYLFCILALVSLPAILTQGHIVPPGTFPTWLVSVALIALVAWLAQTFIQLVLLPVIMVGQNVIQAQNDAKADVDHKTLTYLAQLQDEQMTELKLQTEMLKGLRKGAKK